MPDEKFPLEKPATEWRELLTPEQFRVLRARHGARGQQPAELREAHRSVRLRRMRSAAVRIQHQVRERLGLAQLLPPVAKRSRDHDRYLTWHGTRGSSLWKLRRPPGPRVQRRSAAHRTALLHERLIAEVRTEVDVWGQPPFSPASHARTHADARGVAARALRLVDDFHRTGIDQHGAHEPVEP